MSNTSTVWVLLILLLLLGKGETSMAAVSCNAMELSSCAAAITSSDVPPSPTCCSKLKEQRPCLCHYLKDPNLQRLVNSPNAKKVATTCGSPFPTCS